MIRKKNGTKIFLKIVSYNNKNNDQNNKQNLDQISLRNRDDNN